MEHMAKERDSIEMYRLQGELRILDCLIGLPVVVTDYLQGLSKNTYNKIVDPLEFKPREELQNVR